MFEINNMHDDVIVCQNISNCDFVFKAQCYIVLPDTVEGLGLRTSLIFLNNMTFFRDIMGI